MPQISLNLRSKDGNYSASTATSIPEAHWQHFSEYVEEAETLRNTSFVQKSIGTSLTVTFRPGENVFSRSKPIDEDAAGQVLMRLRPFILQKEPLNFQRTLNLAKKHCTHPVLIKHLISVGDHYKLKDQAQKLFSSFAEKPISNDDVMNWLNGFEYHRDKDKRGKVLSSLGIYGKDQNGKPIILFALTDMLRAVLALSNFLETLRFNSANGKPVCFPEAWISELEL